MYASLQLLVVNALCYTSMAHFNLRVTPTWRILMCASLQLLVVNALCYTNVANFNERVFATSCRERTLLHHLWTPDVQQSTQSPETSTSSGISFTASSYNRLLPANVVAFVITALI